MNGQLNQLDSNFVLRCGEKWTEGPAWENDPHWRQLVWTGSGDSSALGHTLIPSRQIGCKLFIFFLPAQIVHGKINIHFHLSHLITAKLTLTLVVFFTKSSSYFPYANVPVCRRAASAQRGVWRRPVTPYAAWLPVTRRSSSRGRAGVCTGEAMSRVSLCHHECHQVRSAQCGFSQQIQPGVQATPPRC